MGISVIGGATCQCTFGATITLMVLPANKVVETMPNANIMDNKPFVNLIPAGVCGSPSNPAVAAATAAALGVLTPMPCVPVTPAPWTPGNATVLIANMPIIDNTSTLNCVWGGVISIVNPGQTVVMD
ncbi:MAG: DUF4280 domain-containing protein [candidate division Zixibacteria bacterium]|nr:DUF4280 domain-containing protein [candidate division Zixibacteria bacterium]